MVLTLDGNGTVISLEQTAHIDTQEGVEFFNGIVTPGFVNAHCHLELSHMRGLIPRGGGFCGFAEGMGRMRHSGTEEERTAAAAFHDSRMRAEGTIAVGDISNGTRSLPVKQSSEIHYHTFAELFGLEAQDAGSIEGTVSAFRKAGLQCSITPHSTYSLNTEAFNAAVRHGDNSLSIHFMESVSERQLFDRQGPLWEWYGQTGRRTDFLHYGSPARRLTAQVPAGRKIMLIHNTFISREDIDTLGAHFPAGNITYVLCPRSNMYIENTMPDVALLRSSGSNIAVGTDSLASNDSLSVIEELKMFHGVPLGMMLGWATSGGARALGIDAWAGSFTPGKRPGVTLIEGLDWDNMSLLPSATSRKLM